MKQFAKSNSTLRLKIGIKRQAVSKMRLRFYVCELENLNIYAELEMNQMSSVEFAYESS